MKMSDTKPELEMEDDGTCTFILFDGVRIAKRENAKRDPHSTEDSVDWDILEPGWDIRSTPDHKKVHIMYPQQEIPPEPASRSRPVKRRKSSHQGRKRS